MSSDGFLPPNNLWEHLRFVRRAKSVVDSATRSRYSNERFVIRRAVRFELLERVTRRVEPTRMIRRASPSDGGAR